MRFFGSRNFLNRQNFKCNSSIWTHVYLLQNEGGERGIKEGQTYRTCRNCAFLLTMWKLLMAVKCLGIKSTIEPI